MPRTLAGIILPVKRPEWLLPESRDGRQAAGRLRRHPAAVRRLTAGPRQARERMDDAIRTQLPAGDPPAAEGNLLPADVSAYTGLQERVDEGHRGGFSAVSP